MQCHTLFIRTKLKLNYINGFFLSACMDQVICLVSDGGSANRRFYKFHEEQSDISYGTVYKTRNIYSMDGRYLYFISDTPHLIKTTRNCWYTSRFQGARLLMVNILLYLKLY